MPATKKGKKENQDPLNLNSLGKRTPLGEILLGHKALDKEKLAEVLARLTQQELRLGEYLVQHGITKEDDIQRALAEQAGLSFWPELEVNLANELLFRLPLRFIKNYLIVPIQEDKGVLTVAIHDPYALQPLDDIRLIFPEFRIKTVVTTRKEIEGVITHYFEKSQSESDTVLDGLEGADMDLLSNMVEETRDLMEEDSESPIIQLVDNIISRAISERASDIHIEPFEKELIIRYRIDGFMYEVLKPPKKIQQAIISRVKIMARLNIAETRLPQDGRIQLRVGEKDLDIRISILPCYWGERVVMRLLNKTDAVFSLQSLGFEEQVLQRFRDNMHQTTGIILVTGPTGSGKSTTLYGALTELNTPEKNIMTIEDPVEYQIRGINQMHVRSQIDLSFAKGLRAILRQDPDVIMVGEIRDVETARIAVQAALTGHLVFSTLHTNDAVSSLIRLIDMGIEPYLVNSSVNAIMAQRLTRVICPHCKADYTPSQTELDKLSLQQSELAHGKLYYGAGCSACKNTGFLGRMMINEFLEINEEIQDLLNKNASSAEIKEAARRNGMRSMREDAKIKVIKGYTTLEEVLRVSV